MYNTANSSSTVNGGKLFNIRIFEQNIKKVLLLLDSSYYNLISQTPQTAL